MGMESQPKSRRRIVYYALVVFAVLVGAVLINRVILLDPVPSPAKATIRVTPGVTVGESEDSDAVHVDAQRSPADLEGMTEVVVRNSEGVLLEARVEGNGRRYLVHGSGWVPSALGSVTVSAVGYVSASIEVRDRRVEVVLRTAYSLRGALFDALTKERVAGVRVSLEAPSGAESTLTCVTDSGGGFQFSGLPNDQYTIYGNASGYVPLCSGLASLASGIVVDVSENAYVEAPLYPIYVALCEVNNGTNLRDDVFRALLMCRFGQPGANLPAWFDIDMTEQIAGVANSLGITHAYGQACGLEVAPKSLTGEVHFVIKGRGHVASVEVPFQPLLEFMRSPRRSMHSINHQFNIGAITVEAPIAMRICAKAGLMFGGLKTSPGSSTFEVPHGTYVVSPLDEHPLLDAAKWTREVTVPEHSKVIIEPVEGFATLQLTGGSQWPRGVLSCSGPGFTLGILLNKLPVTMPVSPGTHNFSVLVAPGSSESVWRGGITIQAGESKVLQVGND